MKKLIQIVVYMFFFCFTATSIAQDHIDNIIKRAKSGEMTAQHELGMMYDKGEGVHQDLTLALQYIELAAAQGYAKSQNYLGTKYYNARDYVKAIEYYTMAATQGLPIAQYNLGMLIFNGQGINKDIDTASEWFGKSCDAGFILACNSYKHLMLIKSTE